MLTHFTSDRFEHEAPCMTPTGVVPEPATNDPHGGTATHRSFLPCDGEHDGSAAMLRKLTRLRALNLHEQQYVRAAVGVARWREAGSNLVEQGRPVDHVSIIVSGLACRYKILAEGRRQILGFLLPEDVCDPHFVASNIPDHSVALLTKSLVVRLPLDKLSAILRQCPDIGHALQLAALIDNAIAREWLVSVGQRSAIEKLAHLFCELRERYAAIDEIGEDGSFVFLINQLALADSTGLSPVHVNRTLKQMRDMGLLVLRQRRLTLTRFDRMRELAEFDGNYLKMRKR